MLLLYRISSFIANISKIKRRPYQVSFCDTAGIQTLNLLIRSQMLYSVELRCHSFVIASAKVVVYFKWAKVLPIFLPKNM